MIVLIWSMLLLPAIPIGLLWLQGPKSASSRFAVAVLTCSYIWLLLALLSPLETHLIGPTYSNLRVIIPYANIAVVAGSMILLVLQGKRKIVLLASLSTILCWLYVRVISFAV